MPHLHVGLLSSIEPITTRPMVFSDYEVVGPDAAWHPGDGTPRKGQILAAGPAGRPRPGTRVETRRRTRL